MTYVHQFSSHQKTKTKKVLVSQITIYNSSIDLWQFSLSKISHSLLLISHSNPLLCSNFKFKSTGKQFSKVQRPPKVPLFYFIFKKNPKAVIFIWHFKQTFLNLLNYKIESLRITIHVNGSYSYYVKIRIFEYLA